MLSDSRLEKAAEIKQIIKLSESKTICSAVYINEGEEKEFFILLPKTKKGSYEIIGYDWFNIRRGEWNSCLCFPTIRKALVSYSHYQLMNVYITDLTTNRGLTPAIVCGLMGLMETIRYKELN